MEYLEAKVKEIGEKDRKREAPPKWATRLFRSYCNDHLSEAVLGDLIELYERRVEEIGKRKADLLFVWGVIQFIQPFALKRKKRSQPPDQFGMFKNYFKIAYRSMSRQKMYTGIKIGGFAIGLATCLIIALFVRHELSYDKFYANGSRIFRLYNHYDAPDGGKWTSFPAPIGGIIRDEYPEVEKVGRLIPYKWFNGGSNLIRREDEVENTYEEGFAYADPEMLDILEIKMVYGSREHALDKPNSIIFSRSMADKYFPNQDPVGKTIVFNDDTKRPYMVGGVYEDFPASSHIHFTFLITLTGEEFWEGEQTSWCCWNYNPYVRLRADADPAAFEQKLQSIIKTAYAEYLKKSASPDFENQMKYHKIRIQPVSDIYLGSNDIGDAIAHGDTRYTLLFAGIAIFILLLACVNFINLSTARSANRAKEVGLRKVVGSIRKDLVRQFLTESIMYSLISFVIAVALVWITLPNFSQLAGKSLTMPWNEWWLYPILIGSSLFIGVLAGLYPSFYLSAFKPIDVLKGSVARGAKNSRLRSGMVVFQFTTSIVLIIGTFVIYRQMDFIMHTKIGFEKEQVVLIQGANTLGDHRETLKEELKRLSTVENVTSSNYLPVWGTNRDQNGFTKEGRGKIDSGIGAQMWTISDDYIKTLGMKIIAGRDFVPRLASDSASVIVNQAFVKELGLQEPVIGQRIENWRVWTIVGVVEDFAFESLREKIYPLVMRVGNGGQVMAVKVNSPDMQKTISDIQSAWNKVMPNQPFRYTFMDDSYANMYADVRRMGTLFAGFAGLAIFVACLGLFALSSFMAEQRKKEVSIRLVLGASVSNIFRLLTESFVLLVAISFLIAAPLGWYMMSKWLEDYNYKTDITWDVFVFAGTAAILIALMTVSYQSIKVALSNPASNLRSE